MDRRLIPDTSRTFKASRGRKDHYPLPKTASVGRKTKPHRGYKPIQSGRKLAVSHRLEAYFVPWLRLYTDILQSHKIQSLPDNLFRSWVNILCVAKLNNGRIPDEKQVAWHLRISVASARKLLKELEERSLIDSDVNGNATPHDWGHHQFQTDVSTERVKRFRETAKKRFETVSGNVPETEQNRTDTPLPPIETPAQSLAEALCKRHPKKGEPALVEQIVVDMLAPLPDADQWKRAGIVEATHKRWCESSGWKRERGNYAPKLSNWLRDGGWREDPPREEDDEKPVKRSSAGIDPEAEWFPPWQNSTQT